jgi:hypothetical protein
MVLMQWCYLVRLAGECPAMWRPETEDWIFSNRNVLGDNMKQGRWYTPQELADAEGEFHRLKMELIAAPLNLRGGFVLTELDSQIAQVKAVLQPLVRQLNARRESYAVTERALHASSLLPVSVMRERLKMTAAEILAIEGLLTNRQERLRCLRARRVRVFAAERLELERVQRLKAALAAQSWILQQPERENARKMRAAEVLWTELRNREIKRARSRLHQESRVKRTLEHQEEEVARTLPPQVKTVAPEAIVKHLQQLCKSTGWSEAEAKAYMKAEDDERKHRLSLNWRPFPPLDPHG